MKQGLLILIFFTFLIPFLGAQTEEELEFDRIYNERIQLSRIDGVYIPIDVQDAFKELELLSDPEGIAKFKAAPEDVVATKLQGGLGRWMVINWGFWEGSRLSHYIKGLGIHHPDDMSQFLLVSFHRYLNGEDLKIEEQVEHYQMIRKKEYEARIEKDTLQSNHSKP